MGGSFTLLTQEQTLRKVFHGMFFCLHCWLQGRPFVVTHHCRQELTPEPQGLGFRVSGLGLRALGCRVQGLFLLSIESLRLRVLKNL